MTTRALLAIWTLPALLALLAGCAMSEQGPSIAGSWAGPPIRIDDTGELHVLVMVAPGGGWSVELDHVKETPHGYDLFVTVLRPDPRFLYPQALMQQHLATPIASNRPVRVLARLADRLEKPSGPYAPAVESDQVPPGANAPPGDDSAPDS